MMWRGFIPHSGAGSSFSGVTRRHPHSTHTGRASPLREREETMS
jgi:hypothetical protein